MKKFLIVGLGNIGEKYDLTRHNIGFEILDTIANEKASPFKTETLGAISKIKIKGKTVILLKPSTYMNLSGKAVKYWMQKENVSIDNTLIVCDDLHIDYGTFRLKAKGSAGGHNGLKDINDKLQSQKYPRFRFGVSSQFSKGRQVDYVLGKWSKEEERYLPELLDKGSQLIQSFVSGGISNTMNNYNGKQIEDLK